MERSQNPIKNVLEKTKKITPKMRFSGNDFEKWQKEAEKKLNDASVKKVKLSDNADKIIESVKLSAKQKSVVETLKSVGEATVKEHLPKPEISLMATSLFCFFI